jgi:hypothetical protein
MMTFLFGWLRTECWVACSIRMHRISSSQNSVLEELREVTQGLERLSRAEHDLVKDVHPAVSVIRERVEDMHGAVVSERSSEKQ